MPRGKAKKAEQPKGILVTEAKNALWEKIPISDWLRIVRTLDPDGMWTGNSTCIKGKCPYHEDKHPSMVINFNKKIGKCFGCDKIVLDLANFIGKLGGMSVAETYIYLYKELNLQSILPPKQFDTLGDYSRLQEMKKEFSVAARGVVEDWIRAHNSGIIPPELEYLTPGMVYLHYCRKLSFSSLMVDGFPVLIYPKPMHIERKMKTKEYVKEYHKYFEDINTSGATTYGSVMFFYNNVPTEISRFKLRMRDKSVIDAISGKSVSEFAKIPYAAMRSMFSNSQSLFVKDPFIETDGSIGVCGLFNYSKFLSRTGSTVPDAVVTEGEFDALSVIDAQLQSGKSPEMIVLAAGGGLGMNLSFLRKFDIRTIWLVQDAPTQRKHGDSLAMSLLKSKGNFESGADGPALEFKVFTWPPEMRGEDLDEAVHEMGYENLRAYLYTNRDTYFMSSNVWAREHCKQRLTEIQHDMDRQLLSIENPKDSQVEEIRNTTRMLMESEVKSHIECVHGAISRKDYITFFNSTYGIDLLYDEDLRSDIIGINTYEDAHQAIVKALSDYIQVAFYTQGNNYGHLFYAWGKLTHDYMPIEAGSQSIFQTLENKLQLEIIPFVERTIGKKAMERLLLFDKSENEAKNMDVLEGNVKKLIMRAFSTMLKNAPKESSLQTASQGIQYTGYKDALSRGYVYFVNGDRVYRGEISRDPETRTRMEWKELNCSVDNHVRFDLRKAEPWAVSVNDVSCLYRSVDLHSVFDRLKRYFSVWEFQDNETMQEYIPAFVMSVPIQRAVGNVSIHFLTGESASGKTTFLHALGGLRQGTPTAPVLLEAAVASNDTTRAWLSQNNDNTGLLVCMDEFEVNSPNKKKREQCDDLIHSLYSVATGGATVSRGTATGFETREYNVRTPILLAGVDPPTDVICISRLVFIYTKKRLNRLDPQTLLATMFTDDEISDLRADITVGLLSRIPEIIAERKSLKAVLLKVDVKPKPQLRFIESILTVLAVYKLLFGEEKTIMLYKGIVGTNREQISATVNIQEANTNLDLVLYTPKIDIERDDHGRIRVAARDLILEGKIDVLNSLGYGVYVLPEKDWIIIFWRVAIRRFYSEYADALKRNIQTSLSGNRYVIQGIRPEEHTYIVTSCNIPDATSPNDYTVLNLGYISAREAQDTKEAIALSLAKQIKKYEEVPDPWETD